MHPDLTPHFDVALLVFWAFVLFFFGLVVYLRREDRREGYPLEDELTGRVDTPGGPLSMASPKAYRLPFDLGTVYAPNYADREPVDIPAVRTDRFAGAPYVPTGDPLVDGVGPAAWANRARRPDIDMHGDPRLAPMRAAPRFHIAKGNHDIIGWPVLALGDERVGVVADLWIDKEDRQIRYIEVALEGAGGTVLAPMMVSKVIGGYRFLDVMDWALRKLAGAIEGREETRRAGVRRREHAPQRARCILIDAVTAAQFARAPRIEGDVITLYDEDRVQAYFGGGYLYATRERQEPWL